MVKENGAREIVLGGDGGGVGDGSDKVKAFGWKALVCFANEFLADLFAADFDEYCGGDSQQY